MPTRPLLSSIGKKVEAFDSLTFLRFRAASLGDLLSANSSVFIKDYGSGSIASSSIRGGNAAQTAVLWNGVNINNAMLGQVDFSLLPAFLFDEVRVEYGSSSSLWGSGAVGGSIHLGNRLKPGMGSLLRLSNNFGSFHSNVSGIVFQYSGKRWTCSTKAYISAAKNNFRFLGSALDSSAPLQRQHAAYTQQGVLQDHVFYLNRHHVLKISYWLSSAYRQLPGTSNEENPRTSQDDAVKRISVQHQFQKSRYRSDFKLAATSDALNYTDSSLSLFSKSRVNTILADHENVVQLTHKNWLHASWSASHAEAKGSSINGLARLSRLSILLGDQLRLCHSRMELLANVRADYFSTGQMPLTGTLAMNYNLHKKLKWLLSAARSYRQPTLNEMFWQPGGNPDLKPETGYTAETGVEYKQIFGDWLVEVTASAFHRITNDWILWLPSNNNSSTPKNIQQVWSRGSDTKTTLCYAKHKWKLCLQLRSAYVLSTVQQDRQPNSGSIGRQLIYTPRYSGNANLSLSYRNISLFYQQVYTGYRFMTSDNSSWLNPYSTGTLRLNMAIDDKSGNFSLFAAIQNIGNESYTVVAGRPMPLRYYEAGLSVQIKSPLKTKQP